VYELCTGTESLRALIDRIVARTCAVAPDIDEDACRVLVELVFRARIRQTTACGTHEDCRPIGPVWPDAAPPMEGETCGWQDLDPESLPAMFATAAAELSSGPRTLRHSLELRLADELRAILRDALYQNPRCGHSPICKARPTYPLNGRRS
jgi:hypothetical protein